MVQDELPFEADAAIAQARKQVAAGDLAGAIKQLSSFVAMHPRELAAARYLGDLYYRQSDFASAEKTYRAVLAVAPTDRLTHDRLGGIYAAQDRVSEAIAEFSLSLPETSAYGHLVDLHRRLGDLPSFETRYKTLAEESPDSSEAQYAIGAIFVAERKPDLGIVYLERALEIDDRAHQIDRDSCPTMSELGTAYLDIGRMDAASQILNRCLALDHDDYAALVNLAAVDMETYRFDKAGSLLAHANAIVPDGPEALIDLGYLEDVGMHHDAAMKYYLRAIGVDPLARDAYVDLGYDYQEQHLYALAEAAFLKGLSVVPNDGRLHYLLGLTYADQGKHDLARQEYQRATKSDEPEIADAAARELKALQ
jgi:tetratricopeptide (TPR) repeat protein